MTRLTLICHGATDAVRQARFPLDEALEDKAIVEARALSPGMPRSDRIMTSPALRARQTAEALGLGADVVPALADCDYGRWAGQSIMALQESEPDALSTWLTDTDAVPHGGESIRALRDRVAPWMQAQSALGGHAIAISHAPTIRVAVLIALGAPLPSFWHIDVEPLSSVRMTSNGTRWALRFDRV